MNCLVIGGLGFIGSHLTKRLSKEGHNVTILDDLSYARKGFSGTAILNGTFKLIVGSLTDNSMLKLAASESDIVFNLACVHLTDSFNFPFNDAQVNINGVLNILELCRRTDQEYVHFSTGSVYGKAKEFPTTEDHPYLNEFNNPYAISKTAGDAYSRIYNKVYGIKTIVIRPFFVYGFGGWNVISIWMDTLVKGRPLIIHGTGAQTRTPTYVSDLVDGVLLALSKQLWGEAFNIAGNEETSILELANRILDIAKFGSMEYQVRRQGDVDRVLPSIAKAKEMLGYEPKVSLGSGLTHMWSQYYWRGAI